MSSKLSQTEKLEEPQTKILRDGDWQQYCRLRTSGRNRAVAFREAGYTYERAGIGGFYLEQQAHVQAYLYELRDKAEVKPLEVLRKLYRQMNGDITDFQDKDGKWDLTYAREVDITDQIKTLTMDTNGRILHVELYDAQVAAKALLPVCGLQQQPRLNDVDAARMKEMVNSAIDRIVSLYAAQGKQIDRATAIAELRDTKIGQDPLAKRYLM